ncbi:hypothetical protein DUT90_06660 [Polaribacter sp. WD7]|uniref:hypothetical protein n=1 Tax=Polaribacter sp. WD7 TaxID=2269061 RepID=UPI000DF24498|nr:hypothetical protein [Polaribacter sp. WD7]RCS26804.1 hypothetical protein DUT90_06660 [Polaribacter sp. WD7]
MILKSKTTKIVLICLFFIITSFQCEDIINCENETSFITTEDNFIKITRKTDLFTNDTIWISLDLKKEQNDNMGNFVSLELDDIYGFDDVIITEFKNNFDAYNSLNFGSFLIEKKGTISTSNGSILTRFVFDSAANAYQYNFGVILKDSGNYRFSIYNFYANSSIKNRDCTEFSYEIPLFFDDGIQEKTQIYNFTVR